MSTITPAPGGGTASPGGTSANDPNNDPNNPSPAPNEPPKTVSYEEHQRLLDQKKKRDKELVDLKKERDEALQKEKDRVEAELKDKQEWKKIADQKEADLKAERDKNAAIEARLAKGAKIRAFLDTVNGQVPEQYWRLIDTDTIAIDPSTGLPDQATVQKAARDFETNFAAVLAAKGGAAPMPNGAAPSPGGQLTYEEWKKLPAKEMAKRAHEVIPK